MPPSFRTQLDEQVTTLQALASQSAQVERVIALVRAGLLAGQMLFTCGNGGSATDALHLAEELVGRYRSNRRPYAALCLNADVSAMTCIANDFGYEQIFARQLVALARPNDLLVCFSTSGHSPNILRVIEAANERQIVTIALLGKDGGPAATLANHSLIIPSHNSARIQEAHTLVLHAMCEALEELSN